MANDAGRIAKGILTAGLKDLESPSIASDWIAKHFIVPPELSSTPGPIKSVAYQEVMQDLFCMAGRPRKIVVLKGTRIGYTLSFLAALNYLTTRARRHVLIYMPADEQARELSKGSVEPALLACEPTARLLEEVVDKRSKDTLLYRSVGGRTIRILGAHSPARFRNYTSDCVFLDETDAYANDVGGEGDPVSLSAARIANSPFRKQIVGGSPTHEETSLTWAQFQGCVLQLEVNVPCPHCGAFEPLVFENFVWDAGDGTGLDHEQRAESVRNCCQSCGALWPWSKMRTQLPLAEWRAIPTRRRDGVEIASPWAGFRVVPDGWPKLVGPDGEERPWPREIGMYVWAGLNPFVDWSDITLKFLQAGKDVERLKAFRNTQLGLPWRDKATSVEAGELRARRGPVEYPDEFRIIVSVDVQDAWLSVMVTMWAEGEKFAIVDRLEFEGDTALIDGPAWTDMIAWMRSKPEYGGRGVDAFGIDCGHRRTVVYRQKKRIPAKRVYLLKGTDRNADGSMVTMRPSSVQTGTIRVRSDQYSVATWAMKAVLMRWMGDPAQSQFSADLSDAVFDELASEEMQSVKVGGRYQKKWIKTKDRNEALDTLVYAYSVYLLLNPRFQVRRVRNKRGVERHDEAGHPVEKPVEKPKLKRRRVRRVRRPAGRGVW